MKGIIPVPQPRSAAPEQFDARAFARRTLAQTLRKARNEVGLTQADLAKAMRVSQARISQVEHGEEPVSVAWVKGWLKACGLAEDCQG